MNDSRREFLKTISALAGPLACVTPTVFAAARDVPAHGNVFAHWACDLNEWNWPKEWGEPPEKFRDLHSRRGFERCKEWKEEYHEIFNFCVRMAGGKREFFRVHNVVRLKSMTPEQFEEWADDGYSWEVHQKIHAQRKAT